LVHNFAAQTLDELHKYMQMKAINVASIQ